jgi:hypothetical protein
MTQLTIRERGLGGTADRDGEERTGKSSFFFAALTPKSEPPKV